MVEPAPDPPVLTKPQRRKDMIVYLQNHYRYWGLASWNQATSYAACIKLYKLDIPRELLDTAYAMLEVPGAFDAVKACVDCFEARWHYAWQIGYNGRSSGYYVLYEGGIKPSGYKSHCTVCGQRNYRTVEETDTTCGACQSTGRVNYAMGSEPMETYTWPGRGVDMGADYQTWATAQLRERVDVVWDFDMTVEACVAAFLRFCRRHRVVEKTVYVPQRVKVARPLKKGKHGQDTEEEE